jgi:hypothetical protein
MSELVQPGFENKSILNAVVHFQLLISQINYIVQQKKTINSTGITQQNRELNSTIFNRF